MSLITCPDCTATMDYYEEDATCACVNCMKIYDVWNITEEAAFMTLDTSYFHLSEDAKGIMVQ